MREIIFSDMTGKKRHKRLLSIQESFIRNNYAYEAERKTIFRLRKVYTFTGIQEANRWVCEKIHGEDRAGSLAVIRAFNADKRESFWESRQTGSLYIVRDNKVLAVSFLHKLRVEVRRQ